MEFKTQEEYILALAESLKYLNPKDATKVLRYYETRKEQLEAILRDNKNTAEMQARKQKLERLISEEESAQTVIISSFRNDFKNGCMPFFAAPLMAQAESFLKAVEIDDKGIKDLSKPTLLEILKRGKCICGCELIEGSDAYQHILEEMRYVPPESIGNTVRNYLSQMKSYSGSTDAFMQSINSRYNELYRSKARVIEYTAEIEEISEQIKGAESVRNYEIELQEVKSRLKEFNTKKDTAVRAEASAEKEIENKQKLYDSLIAKNAKNAETMLYIRYAEEILEWLTETYTEKETYIRDALEDRVNGIFERMYHGKRRVVIDKKFNVELLTVVSDREINTGKSEGLDRVKNFAFIGGLVALAKEKIVSQAGEHEIDLASEPYPLVMDAPFSNADEEHTGNISRVLPEVAEQVIMFVMKKDFKIAEPVMRSRIGKQFTLTKHSETKTVLK
jgi:DNA sulfur modification protein DndD